MGILLDRGWGKAAQVHSGEDGEGDIRVIIRHIAEGGSIEQQHTLQIDAVPVPVGTDDDTEGEP